MLFKPFVVMQGSACLRLKLGELFSDSYGHVHQMMVTAGRRPSVGVNLFFIGDSPRYWSNMFDNMSIRDHDSIG